MVSCPPDLTLLDEQKAQMEVLMIPEWAVTQMTREFVAVRLADPDEKHPLTVWRKILAKTIIGRWNNPEQRPQQEPPGAAIHRRLKPEPRTVSRETQSLARARVADILKQLRGR